MGLGRFGGGVGASQWLAKAGAEVTVTDWADESALAEPISRLAGMSIRFRCGGHDAADLEGANLLVVSPAVDKAKSEFVSQARRRGIPITSEMNLFVERCPGRIVGVTGTVGKSTTCAMLYQALQAAAERGELGCGKPWLGGNIGRSLLGELEAIGKGDLVVLELSSFQLEDLGALKQSPPMAVITNVSAKHLDRHGSFDNYLACKLNICRYQRAGDSIVLGSRDRLLWESVTQITGKTGAQLFVAGQADDLHLTVLGEHNHRNAALAARVADLLGVRRDTVVAALADFAGLPHRLQLVRRVGGVDYYNDSKATSPEAVAAALGSFDRAVVLIVGGQELGASWEPVLALRPRKIEHAICTGENAEALAAMLGGTAVDSLDRAVAKAYRRAAGDGIVLFSPGCPSFDQFANYEARGDEFVRLVVTLQPRAEN